MAKTIPVRAYIEDTPDLTLLRLQLSIMRGRDVNNADVIRWLLCLDGAQQLLKKGRAARQEEGQG